MDIDIVLDYRLISSKMIGVRDMIIMLTNATDVHEGAPLLLNTDHMMSFFETEIEGITATVVYCANKESWRVKETVAEIAAMVNAPKTSVPVTKKTKTVLNAKVM